MKDLIAEMGTEIDCKIQVSAPVKRENRLKRKLTLLAACLGFAIVILDISVVNVALEEFKHYFNADIIELEWIINGYTLSFAAFLLSAGALADRYGAKFVFQTGFTIFAAASLACALSENINFLIVARIIQGIGAALLVPSSLALVQKTFTNNVEAGHALGLWAAAGGVALALGPVIGGILIQASGWQAIFYVNIPIAVLGVWVTAVNAPFITVQLERRLDLLGQFAAVLALAGLTGAIIEVGNLGLFSPIFLTLVALFILATLLFCFNERYSEHPMLPLHLFSKPTFAASAMIGVAINFAFYGLIFFFSIMFQRSWGYSPLLTGFAFLPMTCAIMCANVIAGRSMAKHGSRPALLAGCLLAAVGYLAILPVIDERAYQLIAIQFFMAGMGIGLAVPSVTSAILSGIDPRYVGVASGVINASRQIGGLLGVAVMGLIIQSEADFTRAAGITLLLAGASLLIGTLLAYFYVFCTRNS